MSRSMTNVETVLLLTSHLGASFALQMDDALREFFAEHRLTHPEMSADQFAMFCHHVQEEHDTWLAGVLNDAQ